MKEPESIQSMIHFHLRRSAKTDNNTHGNVMSIGSLRSLTTATVTRMSQNKRIYWEKQRPYTCNLNFGTFLHSTRPNNNVKSQNSRFCGESAHMKVNVLFSVSSWTPFPLLLWLDSSATMRKMNELEKSREGGRVGTGGDLTGTEIVWLWLFTSKNAL